MGLGAAKEEVAARSPDRLDKAADLLKALSAPVRLAVVSELAAGHRCVHELQDRLSARGRIVSQPLLSQHLKVLRDAGLVIATRRGQERTYALADAHVAHIATDAVHHAHEHAEGGPAMTSAVHHQHTGHEHTHGPGCGHVAVPHGDHTDYVHDGHLHTAHDGHVDECEAASHIEHDGHEHTHGPGCGHVAVPHGDHTDYVHDGHLHTAHDGHWDEH